MAWRQASNELRILEKNLLRRGEGIAVNSPGSAHMLQEAVEFSRPADVLPLK